MLKNQIQEIERVTERYSEDFTTWAEECVKIIDKESGREVAFRLNRPQRRVAGIMEGQRKAGKPVRIIMLKARQWGGSTLVQVYMAWLQLVVYRGWNSLTCAHVKDASSGIRGMYSRLLRCYPAHLKPGKPKDWELTPYEKSTSTSYIAARDCQVAIATSMAPNSVRGSNFAMAHLSEVAFWADGDAAMAEEIVRTVSGTVLRCAGSVVVMESTANGKDNYFYREWQRAVEGKSDKTAVFVPWHEIELYSREVSREETGSLLASFDEYERRLLADGVTLESVAWYHDKRKEYQSHEAMMAEFPSTAEEAFSSVQSPVFEPESVPGPQSLCGVSPTLAVFIPGEPDTVSVFGISRGCVTAAGDTTLEESGGKGLHRALKDIGRLPVMIVESSDAEPSHGAWCAKTAAESGAMLLYDGDDRGWWRPDAMTLSEWVDTLAQMMREGRMKETADMRECYMNFRYASPSRSPQILARMAAAIYARSAGGATDFRSLW